MLEDIKDDSNWVEKIMTTDVKNRTYSLAANKSNIIQAIKKLPRRGSHREANQLKNAAKNVDERQALMSRYQDRLKVLTKFWKAIEDKSAMQKGSEIRYFNNPMGLLDRLELLGGSIKAGNSSAKGEFSEIAHVLWKLGLVSNNALKHSLQRYIM